MTVIYTLTEQDELNLIRGIKNALAFSLPIDGIIVWLVWRVL